jgi:hypothetical protein
VSEDILLAILSNCYIPIGVSNYRTASALFSKALAVIYLTAFISFAVQARGLVGAQGILPVGVFLDNVWGQLGSGSFWRVPTVFWWLRSDRGMLGVCWLCAAIAISAALVNANSLLQRGLFAVLFAGYLSLVSAGQIFMGYQWDYLLLEAGFLAIFLTPDSTRVWLFQWLLFRLMFESGAVKMQSQDETWRNLTALTYHYYTQPLPTPLAWFFEQLPLAFQKLSTLFVLGTELILPFGFFGPRWVKLICAVITAALQVLILLTGNYTFFNFLTIALCLLLVDDRFFGRNPQGVLPRANRFVTAGLFLVIMILSCAGFAGMFHSPVWPAVAKFQQRIAPFGIVNEYGLFANMTTTRIEITVEGSDDGENWQPYVFRFKPNDPRSAPHWVAPFQPRLDWQMWFAALGNYQENPWFQHFATRLLEASPPVLSLLKMDPFHGKPPRYLRATAGDFHFTSWDTRRKTGDWWTSEDKGLYFPVVSLR